jgi:hypothetical protein
MQEWMNVEEDFYFANTSYEKLRDNTFNQVMKILIMLDLPRPRMQHIHDAIFRQSFQVRKAAMKIHGDDMVYGNKKFHLHSMPKGRMGEWEQVFDQAAKAAVEHHLGPEMRALGYTKEANWWKHP